MIKSLTNDNNENYLESEQVQKDLVQGLISRIIDLTEQGHSQLRAIRKILKEEPISKENRSLLIGFFLNF
jgi:DNA-binding PadR family transcriptional regulator